MHCHNRNIGFKKVHKAYMKWKFLKFSNKVQFELTKFGHDYIKILLSSKVMSLFETSNDKYDTKNKETPVSNLHKSTTCNNSFLCKTKYTMGKKIKEINLSVKP